VFNHFFSSSCIKKRHSAQCTSHGRSIASLSTCTDFISAASAGNKEFIRTRELNRLAVDMDIHGYIHGYYAGTRAN